MDELLSNLQKAAAAVDGLPKELRPTAFAFLLQTLAPQASSRRGGRPGTARGKRPPKPKAAPKRRASKTGPRIIPNLKLSKQKLGEFFSRKRPANHQQKYAVFASFLEQAAVPRVGVDEVYTCYKLIGERTPNVMDQVFRNARNAYEWFDEIDEDGRYGLTHIGREFVDHDLPASKEASA